MSCGDATVLAQVEKHLWYVSLVELVAPETLKPEKQHLSAFLRLPATSLWHYRGASAESGLGAPVHGGDRRSGERHARSMPGCPAELPGALPSPSHRAKSID